MSRFNRLVELVKAISRQEGRIDAEELQSQLGVSRRTVFRDIATLRKAGVEIRFDRPAGQYALDHSSLIDPLPSPEDLFELLLQVSLPIYPRPALARERVERASQGLVKILPRPMREQYALLRSLVEPSASIQASATANYAADSILRGLLSGKALAVHAAFLPGEPIEARVIYPSRLYWKDGAWLLCGVTATSKQTILINTARAVAIELHDEALALDKAKYSWNPAELEVL